MAETKITRNEVNFPVITNADTVSVPSMTGNSGVGVSVTFPSPEPNTGYTVQLTLQSQGNNWSWVNQSVGTKSTTGFAISFWNNSGNTTAAITCSYIVIRTS